MRTTRRTTLLSTLLAAALASLATVLALPAGGSAVTQAKPVNTVEPRISGAATVGSTLTASQGSWDNSPTTFSYQWVRCPSGGGQSDGGNCATIGGATTTSYIVSTAEVNRRLRVRVTASNADGSTTVASNATALITNTGTGRPRNVQPPTISGTPSQGQTLRVTTGTWNGQQPITYTFNWLRCDTSGNNCVQQPGFNDDAYVVREGDVGKTIRARGNARNNRGDASRLTAQTAVVTGPQGPAGVITLPNGEKSIPASSVPANESLVVDQTTFGTNPVRSRTAPFQVRIKIKDTRGYVVRDALVFFRSTPLVTQNAQDRRTGRTAGSR